MTRYILGDLLTGRRILDLPVLTGPWDDNLDTAETVSVTVDLNDPDVQLLDLYSSSTPAKTFLAVVEGSVIQAAGPIWTRKYDWDQRVLTLGAKGIASYFDHRLILPLLAQSIGLDQWTIPDPTDTNTPPREIQNPAVASSYAGIWLGTIAKRLVQQAQLWTGGNLPIVLPADEGSADASHTRTYQGTDFKPVGEALQDLTNVLGGPEINFQPRFTADALGVEWVMQVGNAAQPLIFARQDVLWDVTVPESPVSNLVMSEDASKLGSWSWATGGNQSDDVVVSRAYDPTLVDAKYPVMDLLDTKHQSVSVQSTLDGYAAANALAGRRTTETWSFTVEAYPQDREGNLAGPQADAYTTGDFADLVIAPYDPATGRGNPYRPEGGTFTMRIIGRSGDEKGTQIKISCAPLIGGV